MEEETTSVSTRHRRRRGEYLYQQPSDSGRTWVGASTESKGKEMKRYFVLGAPRELFKCEPQTFGPKWAVGSIFWMLHSTEIPLPPRTNTGFEMHVCSLFPSAQLSPWEPTQWFRDQTVLISPRTKVYWDFQLSLFKNILYLLLFFIFGSNTEICVL